MEWEAIVNRNSTAKKNDEYQTRRNKYLRNVAVSLAIGFAFIVTTALGLVHKSLGEFGIVVVLMIAFFNLGRVNECMRNN